MKRILLLLAVLVGTISSAQQVELLKNINTIPSSQSHEPEEGVTWNNLFFYSGWTPSGSREPWVTDGTPEGTTLLQDIRLGTFASNPEVFSATPFGVLFRASGEHIGTELFISDGTLEGTKLLKDINPGEANAGPSAVFSYNGLGYFSADSDQTDGAAIWVTDGTTEGTQLFVDLANGGDAYISSSFEFNGELFMNLSSSDTGLELYKTDGTPEGTVLVKDLQPGTQSSGPSNWFVYNDQLFFTCWNSTYGNELWKTDGTTEGTVLVKDINSGSSSGSPTNFVEWNGLVYFSAQGFTGRNLWVTDGSTSGTTQVSVIDASQPLVGDLVIFNNEIYFTAFSNDNGTEVWKSDGTTAGTLVAYDVNPGTDDDYADELFVMNGDLYFSAEGPDNGNELWFVDGETLELSEFDLLPGAGDGYPYHFRAFQGKVLFAASDGIGYELFVSDGTVEGSHILLDVNPDGGSWSELIWADLGEKVVYMAAEETNNKQLYATDATVDGTGPLTNIRGEEINRIRELTVFDGYLFFNADDGEFGQELWRSDGSPEGTYLYQDVVEGANGGIFFSILEANDHLIFDSYYGGERQLLSLASAEGEAELVTDIWPGNDEVSDLAVYNGEVYFAARDTDDFGDGKDLWKTDGTQDGTSKVYDFGTYDINPEKLFGTSDRLYFFGEQYGSSAEWGLYTSDGTSDGTEFTYFHNLSGNNWGAYLLEEYNGGALYTVFNTSIGRELYFSDGTNEGTYLVRSIAPGSDSPFIVNFADLNGLKYFIANDVTHGAELWSTDATFEGTNMITDLWEGASSGALNIEDGSATIAEINSTLIFAGTSNSGDYELFISDGTAEGTELLVDINPTGASNPHHFFRASEYIYFTATDGVNGYELWRTDGTADGTEMVDDIHPGIGGSLPADFIEFGDYLIFTAFGVNGDRELYRFDQRCLIASISESQLNLCVNDELLLSADVANAEGEIDSYSWEFGDDETGSGEAVSHAYASPGNYEITLTITTDTGCEGEIITEVVVNEAPAVAFFGPDEAQCLSQNYAPDNQTTGFDESTDWIWDFGDGNGSTDQFPTHAFEETGIYTVVLSASNGECSASVSSEQQVYAPTLDLVDMTPASCFGGNDGALEVSGTSILGEVTYSNDGTNFQESGVFDPLDAGLNTIYTMDDYGCQISASFEVTSPDEIAVSSTLLPDDGTNTGVIDAEASGGTSPYTYSINNGETFNSEGLFEELEAGTYTLLVTDSNGCTYEEVLEILPAVGVEEWQNHLIQVFPNPANSQFTIFTGEGSITNYTMLDSHGRLCAQGSFSGRIVLEVNELSSGVYFLKCESYEPVRILILN